MTFNKGNSCSYNCGNISAESLFFPRIQGWCIWTDKLITSLNINKEPILNAGVFVFYQYLDFKNLTVCHKYNINTHAIATDIGKA